MPRTTRHPRFRGRTSHCTRRAWLAWLLVCLQAAPAFASDTQPEVELDGTLARYEAFAVAHSPTLRAEHARWRAGVGRVAAARSLPGPVLSFGYYVRSVETRVGPQRGRLGLSQRFPWPTKLRAASEAARTQVEALDRRLAARTLLVTRRVDEAYWQLWALRRAHGLHSEHLTLLDGLSESIRARVATGVTTVADQQQVDLAAARLRDRIASLESATVKAEAQLRAALGAPADTRLDTRSDPPPSLPVGEPEQALRQDALAHPALDALRLLADASDAQAEVERAERFPSFSVGVDWIITGDTAVPIPDSGKDAVIVGGGVQLPLWQRGPREAAEAAHAQARAQRADHEAAQQVAVAELSASLADVRDAVRRADLFRGTLIPQAEGALESVLGAYATGTATVSAALLSQQALLELRDELEQTRARYARAWARMEEAVGRPVRAAEPTPHEASQDTRRP